MSVLIYNNQRRHMVILQRNNYIIKFQRFNLQVEFFAI